MPRGSSVADSVAARGTGSGGAGGAEAGRGRAGVLEDGAASSRVPAGAPVSADAGMSAGDGELARLSRGGAEAAVAVGTGGAVAVGTGGALATGPVRDAGRDGGGGALEALGAGPDVAPDVAPEREVACGLDGTAGTAPVDALEREVVGGLGGAAGTGPVRAAARDGAAGTGGATGVDPVAAEAARDVGTGGGALAGPVGFEATCDAAGAAELRALEASSPGGLGGSAGGDERGRGRAVAGASDVRLRAGWIVTGDTALAAPLETTDGRRGPGAALAGALAARVFAEAAAGALDDGARVRVESVAGR